MITVIEHARHAEPIERLKSHIQNANGHVYVSIHPFSHHDFDITEKTQTAIDKWVNGTTNPKSTRDATLPMILIENADRMEDTRKRLEEMPINRHVFLVAGEPEPSLPGLEHGKEGWDFFDKLGIKKAFVGGAGLSALAPSEFYRDPSARLTPAELTEKYPALRKPAQKIENRFKKTDQRTVPTEAQLVRWANRQAVVHGLCVGSTIRALSRKFQTVLLPQQTAFVDGHTSIEAASNAVRMRFENK